MKMVASARKRKLTEDTYVTIISNCRGSLVYKNRIGEDWLFGQPGDEQQIAIKELRSMKSSHIKFFSEQWIIFAEEDEDVIPHLKLEKYYQNLITPEYIIEKMDGDVGEFERFLKSANSKTASMILSLARSRYQTGELNNARVIRIIEDMLDADIDVDNPRR
jgi:hypothetical protein